MKKVFCIILIVFTLFVSINGQSAYLFVDPDAEGYIAYERTLNSNLENLSQNYDFPVYGALTSEYSDDIMYCADKFYASRKLGEGSEKTGILLYVDPEMREYYIYVHGDDDVFTDDALVYIKDAISPYLEDSNYYGAFSVYVETCEEILELYENGTPYKAPFNLLFSLAIAIIIGLVVGLITVSVMKSKMTSVKYNDSARQYAVNGSFKLNTCRDIFLYRNITRIRKPENNSSGSHKSSLGGSFRGIGGKF